MYINAKCKHLFSMSFKLVELPEALFHISVVDVEFHPNLNLISSATKSEPSGNMVSHSSGNAYRAIPLLIKKEIDLLISNQSCAFILSSVGFYLSLNEYYYSNLSSHSSLAKMSYLGEISC